MNSLSWDELLISSERWIMYFNEMFEQIKIWCYCKIWDFFWLQIIWICNKCICFNVKIYICIKPVLDLKEKTYRQKLHLCSSQSESRFLDFAVIGENCVKRYQKNTEIHIFSQSSQNLNEDKKTWWTETESTITFNDYLKIIFFSFLDDESHYGCFSFESRTFCVTKHCHFIAAYRDC